ncbi:zinc finger protein 888-like isoform X2 [Leptidea sinapis]|uniref:zinc finger protein 888-like isoform X2 n=1 Tax=Leptidea sinapis TaxID=189913 RepID=UPI0021C33589|nr:zinc finger protein 888-like isoform X2 [Leptidea sinapis]
METIVKIEREDEPEDNIDTETSVAIKTEPDDDTEINVSSDCKIPETLISNDESGDKKSSKPIKMESVLNVECVIAEDKKLDKGSTSESAKKKKNRNPIIQRRKKILISDDEWEPEKETSEQSGSQKVNDYAYSALSQIEIVTITEEERQIEFQELYESRKHMNHICDKCAIGYVIKEAYDMHMKMHSPESGSYVCSLCDTYLKTEETLHRHKLRHYRRYRCMVCGVRYKDRDACAGHVSFSHAGTTFRCDQCTSEFKRPQYLKRHIEQMHLKANPMECPVCHQVFYESGWFRNHVRKHNKEVQESKQASCPVCHRHFKHKSYLRQHLLVHRAARDVTCPECSEVFINSHLLDLHYEEAHKDNFVVHPEVEQRCQHCQRTFETRANLHRHMQRMHTDGAKRYQCEHCKRMYFSKGEVRSHIMWSHLQHAGGHPCTCGRMFRTPVRLREHIAVKHLGAVPPRDKHCPICDKAFANQQVLTRHVKGHKGELYPCTECGRTFRTQSYVKVHYQIVHLHMTRSEIRRQRRRKLIMVPDAAEESQQDFDEEFPCVECGKTFKTQSYVKVHYNMKHRNMSREEAKRRSKELNVADVVGPRLEQVFVKTEPQEALAVPMFETFVDIQREYS